MNAISPFSLMDTLSPTKVLSAAASVVADQAKGKPGLAGAFSDAWTALDANDDGTLNGADVLGHAVNARDAVLQGIADAFGYETDDAARSARDAVSAAAAAGERAATTTRHAALPAAQMLLSSAPPALPSSPAARAVENLPGVAEIRETYAALRMAH